MAELDYNGNIDLLNRPVVKNEDGSISTLSSINFEQDGKHILIPTINENGERMSDEDAIKEYEKTGKHLGVFETSEEAENAGQAISNYMGKTYEKGFNIFDYEDRAKEIQSQRNIPDYSLSFTSNEKVTQRDWRKFLYPEDLESLKRAQKLYYQTYGEETNSEEQARARGAIDAKQDIETDLLNVSAKKLSEGTLNIADLQAYIQQFPELPNIEQWGLEYMDAKRKVQDIKMDDEIAETRYQDDEDIYIKSATTNVNKLFTMRDISDEMFEKRYPTHSKLRTAWEFVKMGIPMFDWYQDVKMSGSDTLLTFGAEAKENFRNIVNKAAAEMSPPQFNVFIDSVFEWMLENCNGNKLVFQNAVSDITGTEISPLRNFFAVADAKIVGGIGYRFMKGGNKTLALKEANKTIESVRKNIDAADALSKEKVVTEPVNDVVDSAKKYEKSTVKADDFFVDSVTPTAMKSNSSESLSVDVANELSTAMLDKKTYKEISKDIVKLEGEDLISEEDIARNQKLFKETIKKKYNITDKEMKNIEHIDVSDGKVHFEIGQSTVDNKPFISEEAAKEYASKHLITGEYEIVQKDNGYKIVSSIKMPMIEASVDDLAQNVNDVYLLKDRPWKSSTVGRYVFARRNIPSEYHSMDIMQGRAQAALKERAGKIYNVVEKLSKDEEEKLGKVLKQSDLNKKWYSNSVLQDTFGLSDKEIDAYYAERALNDLNYISINKILYDFLSNLGYKLYNKDVARHVGSFNPATTPFKDMTTGKYYQAGQVTEKQLKKLIGENKVILQKFSTVEDSADEIYRYMLVDRSTLVSNELPEFMIKYVEGPRRFYRAGTVYAKAPRTIKQGGIEGILKPRTLWADTDEKALKQKVEELNGALRIYRDYMNHAIDKTTAIKKLNESTAGNKYIRIADLNDLAKNYLKEYRLDYKYDVEVVKDGQELNQVKAMKSRGLSFMNGDEDYLTNSFQDLLDNNGRFYRSRGEHLTTASGELTATVSPKMLAYKLVNKFVETETMPLYNKFYAKGLKETFWDVIDHSRNYRGMTDDEFLRTVTFIDSKDPKILEKIKAAKNMVEHWKNTQLVPTEYDNTIRSYMSSVADFLGDSLPSLFGRGTDRYETIYNSRPDKWLHSAVFHNYLGLWNIRQLPLQAMGATNIAFLEPVLAAQNAPLYALFRMGLSSENPTIINKIGKVASWLIPGSNKHFADKLKVLKLMHGLDSAITHTMYSSGDIGFKGWIKNSSEVFFREGERVPYILSNTVAIDKITKKYGVTPAALLKNKKLLEEAIGYADDLYANMSRMSTASYQRGLSGLITQFWSYPMRIAEQLVGRQFTLAQKVSLVLGNLVVFGGDGFLGIPGTYEWLKDKFNFTPETAQATAEGSLNYLSREYGAGIDFTEMGSNILERPYDLLVNGNILDLFSKVPLTNMFLQVNDTLKLLKMVANYFGPEGNDVDGIRAIKYIAVESHLPSSLRNTTKAALALYTGKMYASNYETLKNDATLKDAIILGSGFRPIEKKNIEDYYNTVAYREKTIEGFEKDGKKLINVLKDNPNDEQAAKDFQNFFMAAQQTLLDLYGVDVYNKFRNSMFNLIISAQVPLPEKIKQTLLKQLKFKELTEYQTRIGE